MPFSLLTCELRDLRRRLRASAARAKSIDLSAKQIFKGVLFSSLESVNIESPFFDRKDIPDYFLR